MQNRLSIVGAGGHGRVIADSAYESGQWESIDFYDDNLSIDRAVDGLSVAGSIQELLSTTPDSSQQIVVGIGSNPLRVKFQMQIAGLGWSIATVVHPKATISRNATLGAGTVVMAGAVVNTFVKVGASSILNTSCSIDHDCSIGHGAHVSPGATLSGHVSVGACSSVGAGSTIIQGVTVGANTIVGAGSIVLSSIPGNEVHVGNPASRLRHNIEIVALLEAMSQNFDGRRS